MSSVAIIGAQWGDEGKGKVVDQLASQAELVVRYQGGNNAGHTLVVGGRTTILHLVPSGILQPGAQNVIASGVVVDPAVLRQELVGLAEQGVEVDGDKLVISDRAALILPYHVRIDKLREARLRGGKIGTTGRGIGPCYEDVAARRAVKVGDLASEERLRGRLARVIEEKNALVRWLGGEPFEVDDLVETLMAHGEALAPHIANTGRLVRDALSAGKNVIFEGAQGVLLDVLHGTYPYVTSSHTFSGGIPTGVGVPPSAIDRVIGVVKAYTTRVGAGPFPTELEDEVGKRLREVGHEFGSTTGRPRRCGWLDLAALRYACRLNGFTSLALTKLDVLTGVETLKVCTAYELDGERLDELPPDADDLARVEPVLETLSGWTEDITTAKTLEDLPAAARAYLDFVAESVDTPISLVGVGPGRTETVVTGQLW